MIDIEELERLAKAAQANSDNIGEQEWYGTDEISALMHGLIAQADAGLMAACTPPAILELVAEVRQLREDLQAAKLLAHANGEMFRAEKADRERLARELSTPQYTHVETGRIGTLWADGLSRDAAEEGFINYPGALVTVYYGRKWTFANMAEFDSGPSFQLATD